MLFRSAAQRQCTERIVAKYGTDWCTYIYIYMHIYTYILHCSQKILESYDMMPELSQRRPAATTTIATDEAGDQAAEDREDEDKACLQGTNQIELSYLTVCVRLSGKVSSIWVEGFPKGFRRGFRRVSMGFRGFPREGSYKTYHRNNSFC